jgi:spore germination cell wall hydrolase CwlJ-like protein
MGTVTVLLIVAVSFGLLFKIGTAAQKSDQYAFSKQVKPQKQPYLDQKLNELFLQPGASSYLVDLDMPDVHNLDKTYQSVDLFGKIFTREEMCIAQAVYFEARGEPLVGQVAIAEVILNRIVDARYPDTACEVVYQNQHRRHKCQFSFACDGQSDRPRNTQSWEKALKIVALVMEGERSGIAKRATHYHASYVNPRWSAHLSKLGQVGSHIFYREETI